jgi:hypothetical protein
MTEFKPGDRVRAGKSSAFNSIQFGHYYEVISINYIGFVALKAVDSNERGPREDQLWDSKSMRLELVPPEVRYPHHDGETLVLGPGVFSSTPGPAGNTVLNWLGVNFVPQGFDEKPEEQAAADEMVGANPVRTPLEIRRDAIEQVEGGWHTAPSTVIDLTPQAAMLAGLGLEIRVQTRPKQ